MVSWLLREDGEGREGNILVEESGQDLGKFSLLGSLTTSREGLAIGEIFLVSKHRGSHLSLTTKKLDNLIVNYQILTGG